MKYFILISVCFVFKIDAQNLHHQMLSAQGTSVTLTDGLYISQTIGQQSVIGNYTKEGMTYGQGFQQSMWGNYIDNNPVNTTITTITYPNPFIETVNFRFSQPIETIIEISLFDVRGRLIFHQEKKAESSLLTVDLPQLAASNYLVRLQSNNYIYYTQILKDK
jgi:hypothetical protein